ncbi:uncharacterized protein ISCGN_017996 [Ixodes scapularis]
MPMTQRGDRAPALVGRALVHRKAGTSVPACGDSVRPSSDVAQCIDPREGVPATVCCTTRNQRRRGTKSSGMPVTQRGNRVPALVGGVWVHRKAGTSVSACGASVCPSSSVAQCIDVREGVPATVCRTIRNQRRRGTKSSGMPMTQRGDRTLALVGGVWVHRKAGTSVSACGASVCPSSSVAQCIDVREGVPATVCRTTRNQRRRGTKSSGMPMTQRGDRTLALVGGVWVHRKAGTSVSACGASVCPSSPMAQCIDVREGVPATVCRTTRNQRRRGTKSSGMPMTQRGDHTLALVGGVWVHRKAGTSVSACGASVCPSSSVAQCIDVREGVPATVCRTTRNQRRRGTKSSGMPMTQRGDRTLALVGGVWVHRKAGTSVSACGASVCPSSSVAQCIDVREGVPATVCRTTRNQREEEQSLRGCR